MPDKKRAAFMTLGCKVNQYETDAMEELLLSAGYEIVDFKEEADIYIINTCSVTNMADRKSRQMIRRARKRNPGAVVAAAGCYVQASADELSDQGIVDILIGNNKKKEIVSILEDYFQKSQAVSEVPEIGQEKEYEDLAIHKTDGHTRAYVKIQDGCNQFCSYCIIPYVRGRIRSRDPEEVVEEISALAGAGYKEVVLTGIHLSSYGKDFQRNDFHEKEIDEKAFHGKGAREKDFPDTGLIDIIGRIHEIPGIERIRLGSLEPRVITEDFVKALRSYEKVCPHFHLSLQSGCDETLKRMNRHYTTGDYEQAVKLLRDYYEDPALTTDVIAGFVGETEEEFARTRSFLKKIRLYEMHIFKYSVRQGTRAEKMTGHVPESIKTRRSGELLALAQTLKTEYLKHYVGTRQKVLLEEMEEIAGVPYMLGYTKTYVRIAVKFEEKDTILTQNAIVVVKVEGFIDKNLLFGKVSIEF